MTHAIVGIYSNHSPVNESHIAAMRDALFTFGETRAHKIDSQHLCMHVTHPEWDSSNFAKDEESGVHLQILGHLDNHENRISSEQLLKEYLSRGDAALMHGDGIYIAIIWDQSNNSIRLINDRLGCGKLYFYEHNGVLVFSSELRAMLAYPAIRKEIDPLAVSQFLITSHLLDERSLINGVTTLNPASILEYNDQGLTSRCYWKPQFQPQYRSVDEWAEDIGDTLKDTLQDMIGHEQYLMPTTGGLDSRVIAACLPDDKIAHAHAYSIGHPHCYDVRYGKAIARSIGIPHETLNLPDDFFSRYMRNAINMNDGEISIEAYPLLRLLDVPASGSLLVTGYLGDVLSGTKLDYPEHLSDDQKLSAFYQQQYVGMGFSETQLQHVLDPDIYRQTANTTFELMRSAIHAADADSFEDKTVIVRLRHRQARYTSYHVHALSRKFAVRSPFTRPELMDRWLQVPLQLRRYQRVYRRLISTRSPATARIPETSTQRSVLCSDKLGHPCRANNIWKPIQAADSRLHPALIWRLNRLQSLVGQSISALSRGWFGAHNRKEYAHHENSIRVIDPAWFREKLNQKELIEGWFKQDELNILYDEHMSGKMNHSIRINNIVAFLEWRRLTGV